MTRYSIDGFEIRLVRDAAGHRSCEAEQMAAGYALPLAHRWVWAEAFCRGGAGSYFVDVRDGQGAPRGGFRMDTHRSRAMPGHLLLRIERFGQSVAEEGLEAALQAVVRMVRGNYWVLRLSVETYARNPATQDRVRSALHRLGFTPATEHRSYVRTLVLDLTRDEAAIFAGIHTKARRDVKVIKKHPVVIRQIQDQLWVPRMNELLKETMERTSGTFRVLDWAGRMKLTNENPNLAALVGLFRTDREGPESMLAFAWSCMNGNYAHYDTAASTRKTDLKLPMNYALLWELICWAKRSGATWFDFGGVTAGHLGSATDKLGGISDFKRYFTDEEIEVGGEWILEPRRFRALLAKRVSAAAHWVSTMKQRRASKASPSVGEAG